MPPRLVILSAGLKVNFNNGAPFGKKVTAKDLQGHAAKPQEAPIVAVVQPEVFFDSESESAAVDELCQFFAEQGAEPVVRGARRQATSWALHADAVMPKADAIEVWSPSADKRMRAKERTTALALGHDLLIDIVARELPLRFLASVRRYVSIVKVIDGSIEGI